MFFLRMSVIALVLAFTAPASTMEEVELPAVSITNSLALFITRQDLDRVCPESKLPHICAMEFQLAIDSFELAEKVIRLSFIAHRGGEVAELLAHANRLAEQGWSLYMNVLAEYSIPPLTEDDIAKHEKGGE